MDAPLRYGYDDDLLTEMGDLGCAGDGCGTLVKFHLRMNGEVIERARWWARSIGGAGAAHHAAEQFARTCEGLDLHAASRLGCIGFGIDAQGQAMVAEDAFHHALGVAVIARMHGVPTDEPHLIEGSCLVAMSGGVDSAVCMYRALKAATGPVIGCTLRLWIDPQGPDPDRACCAPESVRRARHTCHTAGIGHISLDERARFHDVIVKDFIEQYQAGETPNPCVRCNGRFRLDELVLCADALSLATVATGHYVRLEQREGRTLAVRGVDERKDQSYMLAAVSPDTLARYTFPLGASRKPDVRAEAANLGLVQAKIRGSQEVCFLGGGSYRDFLSRHKASGRAGKIILHGSGEVLGEHDGIAAFTPGQRRGLPISHELIPPRLQGQPLFVRETDPLRGAVIVGTYEDAVMRRLMLRDVNLYASLPDHPVGLQVRYGAKQLIYGRLDGNEFTCDEGVFAPAPGQIAVLYDGETVIGSARIARTPVRSLSLL